MLWGNIDILVQKPVGLANLFSVKLCFVCVFPLFKFMLNKPNSVSKPVIKQEILFSSQSSSIQLESETYGQL